MIKWYKKYKKNIEKKAELLEISRLTKERLVFEEGVELKKSLYTQSLENVAYLSSVIKTSQSQVYNIKTRGSEKNKMRKEFLKDQINWYKVKLEEELGMVSYYGVNLKII